MNEFKLDTCETCDFYPTKGTDSDHVCYLCSLHGGENYAKQATGNHYTPVDWFVEIEQLRSEIKTNNERMKKIQEKFTDLCTYHESGMISSFKPSFDGRKRWNALKEAIVK